MAEIVKRSIKLADGKTLRASCSAEFGAQATSVLKLFKQLQVQEGQRVEFGCTVLSIAKEEQELVIVEPDLFIKEPFSHWIDDITISLKLSLDQIAFLTMLNLEPCSCSLFQKMLVSKGAIGSPHLHMRRQAASAADDSGWVIEYLYGAMPDPENYDYLDVFELFQTRPRLLEMICLPVGYKAVIRDNSLQAVVDGNDCLWWSASSLE